MKVAVLGASPKPERYSNKAVRLLLEQGYSVIPINPGHAEIEGLAAVPRLQDITPESVHTLTVYMNPRHSAAFGPEIIALKPKRVIFNPGAENPALAATLGAEGIETCEACTLVLLHMGQF